MDSDSSLSSPPATDDEMAEVVAPAKPPKATPQKKSKKKNGTILSFFNNKSPSPVRKKRPASPPHEYVPADNPDIAFIVMFRSRFADAFPPKTPHFGPQDLERGVGEVAPSPQVETLLCALLALLLNRKKPIEKGHYGRALEEAILGHRSQWPREWNAVNPISGGRSFNTMSPTERLTLLKQLVLWCLHDSDVVNTMIKETYKARTSKEKNDVNIPLSVQPWGVDGDGRRYWLIEGQDDTPFRVYRESNPKLKTVTWWSVAGSIQDIRDLAQKLEDEDGTRDAKSLAQRMRNAIPRFEATEEKRKRREYRLNRQAALAQPVFSLYEGRTRGKRMRYTFSDEEEELSDALGVRRSRRGSGRGTPAAPAGPTVTASGRQVKSRATGAYGELLHSGQQGDKRSPAPGDYARSNASEEPQATRGRATRANGRKHIDTYNSVDEMDDDEATSWDGGDDEEDEPDHMDIEDDEEDEAQDTSSEEEPKSLIVHLRYPKGATFPPSKRSTDGQDSSAKVPSEQNRASGDGQPASGASHGPTQAPATGAATQLPVLSAPQPTPQHPMASSQPAAFPTAAPTTASAPQSRTDSVPEEGAEVQSSTETQNTAQVLTHPKIGTADPAPTPPYANAPNAEQNGTYQNSHSPFRTSLAPPTPASS